MRFTSHIFNSHPKADGDFFLGITKILGFKPKKLQIYKKAFLHRSANKKDRNGHPINYERLEFLGDAMLGTIISKHLYNQVPEGDEGYLTKMRSKIVSRKHLNELGRDLNLINFVESRIPKSHFGDNIHGNVFEALVGAIYLGQVASRWGNITQFKGFDLITPNEREARFAMADQDSGVRQLSSELYDAA
ncbi:MAG: ribonuclease III domain-containing protein, partial [Bacteroidota bacterium]